MFIMVDIEADGPIPGVYSMIEIGAIAVEPSLSRTFYGQLKPISDQYVLEALKHTNWTRKQTEMFDNPQTVMYQFSDWINSLGARPMFVSDNNGFDWMFTNWYFHKFCQKNPFGHSSTNLGSLYKGLCQDFKANFKRFRKTKHTHNPVDDARGNAEAMLYIAKQYGLKLDWTP